jgi:uncharacterized protein
MPLRYPDDMVGRRNEWRHLAEFLTSGLPGASLGVVWGRRRVGKSFLLESATYDTQGLYYPATRGSSAEALRDLGARIGGLQGAAAPLAFERWDAVIDALLALGRDRECTVALDEYPYLLEHTPELDSIIQRAFGPRQPGRLASRTRLVLCGSAMSVMAKILSGTAPLRGRAGLELRLSPFDFRVARELHGIQDRPTAFRTYAVIGGVAAYARVMSENDVPAGPADFDRWVCRRVLSPAAPLFGEVDLLLSEDPVTAKARKLNLYHATLAGVASGQHAYASLTSHVKISGASLAPILEGLVAAELIARVEDPLRDNRPTYHPADPLLRFHYALIRRHRDRLARHGADTADLWSQFAPTFSSQVLGPCFEETARYWARHFADPITLGGAADHVGPTTLTLSDGQERQLDVVVAADDADTPGARTVRALGEAKFGERLTTAHVRRLEAARDALQHRGRGAKLLLFGTDVSPDLRHEAGRRRDLEVIDLERLYDGA